MKKSRNYKKVTLADVKKFYTNFYGASNAELAIVGDFDAAEAQKLIADLFGSWKSPAPLHAGEARIYQGGSGEPFHRNSG